METEGEAILTHMGGKEAPINPKPKKKGKGIR